MQEKLTSREQDIFNMLLEGVSPKEIGHKLNISYHTVDFHRTKIYNKLGVKNIQELLSMYGQKPAVVSAKTAAVPWYKSEVRIKPLILAAILALVASTAPVIILLSKAFVSKTFTEKPFTVILNDNEPWGYHFKFHPSALDGKRITEGVNYTFSYSFISNVDIYLLYFYFLDQTVEADGMWTVLSPTAHFKGNIKANTEYNGSLTIIPTKTASSNDPNANLLTIDTNVYEPGQQPTITFTKFEITINN